MITIINYGLGNLGSIKNMLKKVGAASVITDDLDTIRAASKLILPGVGAFDTGMQKLADCGLIDVLHHKALEEKIPILGICLGVQLMTRGSHEGQLPGLGWFAADTVAFDFQGIEGKYTVPNMGWNEVELNQPDSPLFEEMFPDPRFYFVHSFHLKPDDPAHTLTYSDYGYSYASALAHENLLGVQFHPEKSHKFGQRLLRNFVKNY
ncbi:MAG: imidazole glycerol phosphate synthase subunit HisH [Bernardetiaceae bacterium]